MDYLEKITPLNGDDRELLSNLTATFDLGTQTIIGEHEDEIFDERSNLMTEN